MTLKNDVKFKQNKPTFRFKYDMKNLGKFTKPLKSLKFLLRCALFFPKYIKFELKKYRKVIFHDTDQWCKI